MWLILDNLDSFGGFLETVIFIGHTGGAFYAGFVTTNVEIQKHVGGKKHQLIVKYVF